jgi:hypothetical protein
MPAREALRAARALTNRTTFREFNRKLETLDWPWGFAVPIKAWVCECANPTCNEPVEIAGDEYEAGHRDPDRFFISPGDDHRRPDRDHVIERGDRYWIVETTGAHPG